MTDSKLVGWRKYSLGVAVLVTVFAWVFIKFKPGAETVPDLPPNVVDLVKWTFGLLVAGNALGKFAKAAGSKEPA